MDLQIYHLQLMAIDTHIELIHNYPSSMLSKESVISSYLDKIIFIEKK